MKIEEFITYKGSNCLRMRLLLSTLSGKSVEIEDIRTNQKKGDPRGLLPYERKLLDLLLKVTNGGEILMSSNGRSFQYRPGMIFGGKIEQDCGLDRSITYYLELLICLAPFCKQPLDVTLTGITNDQLDASVDSIKQSSLPLLSKYLNVIDKDELKLEVKGRGLKPDGGGRVHFKCPVRKTLKPLQLLSAGKVKRVRGVAWGARVSPHVVNRIVCEAKGLLLKYLPDVYIHSDHAKGEQAGQSPGFGISLVAETINGVFYVGEAMSNAKGSSEGPSVPEDVAKQATYALFEEVYRGGCVSSINQGLSLLFMALGHTDVSKLQLGPLSPHSVQLLRHMRDFLRITFKLEIDQMYREQLEQEYQKGSQKILATALGIGYVNLSKNAI
jgi:RNA 3'-terminal phosphate cyclase-like protein